ncbi:MAG: fructosamine kinase family protein [Acidobacteriota bacterium]
MSLDSVLPEVIRNATGKAAAVRSMAPVGGGCINQASRIELEDGRRFFLKSNPRPLPRLFESEAEGLLALRQADCLRVPEVVATGGGREGLPHFILMEYIPTGRPGPGFFEKFGRGLAQLHRQARGEQFGFENDNYLGSTPQPNQWTSDWVRFVRQCRLGHQLKMARQNGLSDPEMDRLGQRLLDRLDDWIGHPDEPPGLLHGDLWGGNYLCDDRADPVLIDPAAYYGRGEADLAMTQLFGGFDASFYHAYEDVHPLAPGSQERLEIYKLYHLLNHLNLFGRSYFSGCMGILRRFGG